MENDEITVDKNNASRPALPSPAERQTLWQLVREDWETCGGDWTRPGFRALAVYRLGSWALRQRKRFRLPAMFVYRRLHRYVRNHYGIEIHFRASIGRRCKIVHQNGITIHPQATIGDDCLIEHMVTIGAAKEGRLRPTIGNRVNVGVGAVVIGSVSVGDDVRIGPNTIVMMDVPAGATVFANPSRILPNVRAPGESET